MMAWLVTQRECLSRRNCVVLFLMLLNIIMIFGLLDLYSKQSNMITSLGFEQSVKKQLPEYSQSMKHVGEKMGKIRAPTVDQMEDIVKQTGNEPRPKSTDVVSNVVPLYDFIKYPCLDGLPFFSTTASFSNRNCVRTINLRAMENINTENCVPLETPKGSTPMCTYPPKEDRSISIKVHRSHRWDVVLVTRLAQFLKSETDLELLDIGCNIGVYTLTMAHEGIKVTAIDAVIENIQLLSKSVKIGNLENKVTLIWNALSNEHKEVTLQKFKNRAALTQIKDIEPSTVQTIDSNLTGSIMLDDLLPIFKGKRVALKMDIEGSEYNALLGGKKFFGEIDVPIIQIEVAYTKKTATGPMIIEYLASYGFRPFTDIHGKFPSNTADLLHWPKDVYFLKT